MPYLSNMMLYVELNDTTTLSVFPTLKLGIPLGSVLEQPLFLVFINSFNSCLTRCSTIKFVNDA